MIARAPWGARKRDLGLPAGLHHPAHHQPHDVVAVREVTRNVADLICILDMLSRDWRMIAADVTEAKEGLHTTR
jgi:hypothetical protein